MALSGGAGETAAFGALVQAALDRAVATGAPTYVYCTAVAWHVDRRPPPFGRQHLRCEPAPPRVVRVEREHEEQRTVERVLWLAEGG